jgi:hypothetical protein
VRQTDGLSTQPRAIQRGARDDKGFKNTFLQTSPRCTALTTAPSPSCGTCASGDVVPFAAAAPHQPRRSAARALKSMACGTRRCGRRGSGGAAWARYLWAAAGFRRAGSAARRRGKPGGGSALGRRTDTNKQDTQTNKPLCARAACPRCCASLRRHWSASVHQVRHADARKHARTQTRTDTRIHTPADARTHANKHRLTHARTRTHAPLGSACRRTQARTHECAQTREYTHTQTHARTQTNTQTRIYSRAHAHPHTLTLTFAHTHAHI